MEGGFQGGKNTLIALKNYFKNHVKTFREEDKG
jgi:hypothetical protein